MKQKWFALLLVFSLLLTGCQKEVPSSSVPSSSEPSAESSSESSSGDSSSSSSEPESSSSQTSAPSSTPATLSQPASAPAPSSSQAAALNRDNSPAQRSWTAAYDSFYAGSSQFQEQNVSCSLGDCELRPGFVFPIYTHKGSGRAEMRLFADNMAQRDTLELFLFENASMYGTLLNKADSGDFYGEGLIQEDADGRWLVTQAREFPVGQYDYRWSMTITKGVESQLLALGFSNETTAAKALWIDSFADGTLFTDGDKAAFLVQSTGKETVDLLELGRVYPMTQLAQAMEEVFDCLYPESVPTEPGGEKANPDTAKPVIYLYPEAETQVTVRLDYAGEFTYTYPAYENGWQVTAYPDGRLVNQADGSEHYYLFWEGNGQIDWDFSEGFVVPGSQAEDFLREKLAYMGLTPREYNDFLVYWVPKLQQNPYNLITFATGQYEELAPLTVSPAPDSVLRVHMVYRAIDKPVEITPQKLSPFVRRGFTVVEWGGTRA